jgi:hypothetical protein
MLSKILLVLLILVVGPVMATEGENHQYVIERSIPDAGKLSADELRDISRKSRDVLEALGPKIQWIQSYVVEDKVYCVYTAPDEEMIREHAEMGGFPADKISRVSRIIDLSTAE